MKKMFTLCILLTLPALLMAQKSTPEQISRYRREAALVTIIRDNWGVPHIYGPTDALVVFGLMYSQCEDNFKGIEANYLYQLGRQAEADGETKLYTENGNFSFFLVFFIS